MESEKHSIIKDGSLLAQHTAQSGTNLEQVTAIYSVFELILLIQLIEIIKKKKGGEKKVSLKVKRAL